jgi:parallel beta-helix repeat protein
MTLATRPITGTVLQLDGTAYTTPAIRFSLLAEILSGGVLVPKTTWSKTTSSTGHFAIDLPVPDTGSAVYSVSTIDNVSQTVYLSAGATLDISSLLTVATYAAQPATVWVNGFTQSAINAAVALLPATGGVLNFPPGSYIVTSNIDIPTNTEVRGYAATLSVSSAITGGVIRVKGTSALARKKHVVIHGFNIYCNNYATYGIEADYLDNCKFEDMLILSAIDAGIMISNGHGWTNRISEIEILYCLRGIHLGWSANSTIIDGCTFNLNKGAGLYINDCTAVSVTNCDFESNGRTTTGEEYNIFVQGARAPHISGSYFEGEGVGAGCAIRIEASVSITKVTGPVISGCYFNGTTPSHGEHAVSLKDTDACQIVGGAALGYSGTTIYEESGVTNTVNTISD